MLSQKIDPQLSREAFSKEITDVLQIAEKRRNEYKKAKYFNKHWYYSSQSAIIVLAGIAPVLLLGKLPPVFPALSATVASITAGLASNFKFREKYEIHVRALEDLEIVADNFLMGTGSYSNKNDEEKKNIFMQDMDIIHRNRRSMWIGVMIRPQSPEDSIRMPIVGSSILPPELPSKP